ncbi:hypothetical protein E1B28_011462 [Marasmius oreades]|uniref:Nudix hydrolase domain-containing protein n=1 Tax=Marasmius oreades TaxID=181124 RepID=A0A9P7RUQ6_9AGAR|nr:uncharacterized protein E1B28_011462 [Marasmius oreades]KAG7089813.1 hypothetical protein E1B28_011462 [Marasmius oreades]
MTQSTPIELLSAHGFSSLELKHPSPRLAAVLVLLHHHPHPESDGGHLRVLLTTRSKSLRTHPGQTALPGGRKEDEDGDLIYTALREANEEVGLPIPEEYYRRYSHSVQNSKTVGTTNSIRILCTLEPVLSLHKLIVTPVVAFLEDPAILDTLQPSEGEVSRIFTYPLEAILDPTVLIQLKEPLVDKGTEDWPYDEDLHHYDDHIVTSLDNTPYRYHRFRSSASPVTGLTSDILIKAATIAYHPRRTSYVPSAPDQVVGYDFVQLILNRHREPEGEVAGV